MPSRRFIQCDVFTPSPVLGNALAVVVDGEDLNDVQMQQFAAWTNLAETTFILPPEDPQADYRLKIFTPKREMLFAGHPTLGSCAAWLHCGGVPREPTMVRQQCAIGLVEINCEDRRLLEFVAPPTRIRPLAEEKLDAIVSALQIPPDRILACAELDNGPVWQVFELDSAATVLSLDASLLRWPEFQGIGLIGKHEQGAECAYEVRMLAPSSGMGEDPITGSLNSALAHWLQSQDRVDRPYQVAQGTVLGRHGRVSIRPRADGSIAIGGETHILIDGRVEL